MGMDYVQDKCKCWEKKVGALMDKIKLKFISRDRSMPFPNITVFLSHLDMQSATAPYLAQDSLGLIRHSNYSRLYQRQKQILKETSHKKAHASIIVVSPSLLILLFWIYPSAA